MNKSIALFIIWMVGFSMANAEEILNTASVEDQQAASNSAKLYLYTLDAGKYEESWTLIAPEMQNTISKSIYTAGINLLRSVLGDIEARKPIGINFS